MVIVRVRIGLHIRAALEQNGAHPILLTLVDEGLQDFNLLLLLHDLVDYFHALLVARYF